MQTYGRKVRHPLQGAARQASPAITDRIFGLSLFTNAGTGTLKTPRGRAYPPGLAGLLLKIRTLLPASEHLRRSLVYGVPGRPLAGHPAFLPEWKHRLSIIVPKSVSFAAMLRLAIQLGYAGVQDQDKEGDQDLSRFRPAAGPGELAKAIFEEHSRFRTFEAGEEILAGHDTRGDVYLVLEGEVEAVYLSQADADLRENPPADSARPGEKAALDARARIAGYVAARTTQVAIISRAEMTALLQADPSIASWINLQMATHHGAPPQPDQTASAPEPPGGDL